MDEPVTIACLLTEHELQERRREYLNKAAESLIETLELADGFEFRFRLEDGTMPLLAEIVTLERKCCPFLDFSISVRSGEEVFSLSLTGPEGSKEAVASLFPWNKTATAS